MSDFPNSQGVLNKTKEKKSDKSPDYYGTITVDEDLVRHLIAEIKAGNKLPQIALGAWLRDGKYGKFISMALSKPREKQAFGNSNASSQQRSGGFSKPAPAKTFNDDSDLPF